MKRLSSNAVSNSRKKRVLRFRERTESSFFSVKKKKIEGATDVPVVKNEWFLKKRHDRTPGTIIMKK